jgi:glycosyltransferase involved in cell wall biosynthesis
MKVLHVIPSISARSGGPGQAILPMCRSLSAQGIEVLLTTTNDGVPSSELPVSSSRSGKPANAGEAAIREFEGVRTICFPAQLGRSYKYSRPFALWLDQHVSEHDLVHIHAVFNHSCIAAARACRERRVPYVVRPLGTLDPWSMNQKGLRKKIFWHGGIKTMLTRAAAIHYTTQGEQQAVESSLGLNHGVVIPLGVDLSSRPESAAFQETAANEAKLAERFPELRERPYVLVLSRLHPKKALEVLLEAFLSLIKRPEFREWRLVLAGEGPAEYVTSLKTMVAKHEATDFVVFPGWLDGEEKAAALRDAQLLALPSHHENFGLCVMESMAYGTPVLVSPQVNLAPEIETARAGWIAAVAKESLEAALAEALGSDAERARRGAAGLELANNFAWPVVATKLADLYASLLETAAPTTTLPAHA